MLDESLADAVVSAERALLDPTVRSDPTALEHWLDPDFTEIGQSGLLWTRAEILDDLPNTDQSDFTTAILSETSLLELTDGCFLLTYVVAIEDRRSRRSSIWRMRDGALRMVFNQGTPLDRDD